MRQAKIQITQIARNGAILATLGIAIISGCTVPQQITVVVPTPIPAASAPVGGAPNLNVVPSPKPSPTPVVYPGVVKPLSWAIGQWRETAGFATLNFSANDLVITFSNSSHRFSTMRSDTVVMEPHSFLIGVDGGPSKGGFAEFFGNNQDGTLTWIHTDNLNRQTTYVCRKI